MQHNNMQTEIYFHELDRFPYRSISPIWMIIYTLISCYFFIQINQIITLYIKNNDLKIDWLKQNTLLSFIHSSIASILVLISIIRTPELFQDPMSHANHFNYLTLTVSAGYFLFDSIDYIKNSTSSTISILAHHFIIIMFFLPALLYTRCIGTIVIFLSAEMNSVFLHARRLLRWYPSKLILNYDKNLIISFVDIVNYITFILFRFGTVIYGIYVLYTDKPRIIYYELMNVLFLAFGILNVILFHRLIQNQRRVKSKIKQEKQDKEDFFNENYS